MEDIEDLQLDADDEIFFGLPEDVDDVVDVDYIWEDIQSENAEPQPSTSRGSRGEETVPSKKSKKSSGPRLQCSHCPKTYANERTLKTHLNSVRLKALATRAPTLSGLRGAMKDLCDETLSELQSKFTLGDLARRCAQYSGQLAAFIGNSEDIALFDFLAEQMNAVFCLSNVVLLSSLRMRVTVETNKLLNNLEFRSTMQQELLKIVPFGDKPGFNFFTGNFIRELSNRVLLFACREILDTEAPYSGPKKRSKDDFSSAKFCKLVHYIGGSVVAGVNRRRRTYPSATKIQNFAFIMKSKFVEDKEDLSTLCDPEVKEWTVAQDRGCLSHISKDAYNFFHKLISFVMCFEEQDGSLLIEKVNNAVSGNYEVLRLWDVLVGSFMEEDESLEWLASIVEVICRCVSRGIVKQRLNEALKKPTANGAHRSRLAR